MAKVLLTGGAGFIGSHTCLVLLAAGHQLVVFDNFSTSSPASLNRVRAIAGDRSAARLQIVEGDIRCSSDLERAFRALDRIDAVIHLAGLKAVTQSVLEPLLYWDVNVSGSQNLLRAMAAHGCHTLVFSSSATVYGCPERIPIPESAPLQPINPYGHTKAAVERMLADLVASATAQPDPTARAASAHWRIACLRYFNPVGAHPSGQIGENPRHPPGNLFPRVCAVALGQLPLLQVFGDDWPTPDGTGIRDYLHVMDLAEGHRAALEALINQPPQLLTLNLGSGRGHSVLEVIEAFEAVCGRSVPIEVLGRRLGDTAESVADPAEAQRRLGWRAERELAQMCADGWAWQREHRGDYGSNA